MRGTAAGIDPGATKSRDIPRDGVVEAKLASLVHLHDGDRRNWLGHREDAEYGILIDGARVLRVQGARGSDECEFAVPHDHRDHACHLAGIHPGLKGGRNPFEPCIREANLGGTSPRQYLGRCRHCSKHERHRSNKKDGRESHRGPP